MSERIRKAKPDELDSIYLMGFDVWSDGSHQVDYLAECHSSPKYRKGTWFVLEESGRLLSSLITYEFDSEKIGIGSIATPVTERNRGHASKLISGVVQLLEIEKHGLKVFLYSDINPVFYERFGFKPIPSAAQRYQTTTCMVRGADPQDFKGTIQVPEYF